MRGSNPGRGRVFPFQRRPDRIWGPHRLLFNGYRYSFPHVSRPGREVDRSPLSGDEVKNEWSYTFSPLICFNGVDRGKFTFPFSSPRMGEHFTHSSTMKDDVAVFLL